MKLSLDTPVLLTVFNQGPGSEDWMEALIQARRQGLLVLCEVVYAELAPAFESRAELDKVSADLGAHLDPIGAEAAPAPTDPSTDQPAPPSPRSS